MKQFSNEQLIQKAKEIAILHKPSEDVRIAEVGCALTLPPRSPFAKG